MHPYIHAVGNVNYFIHTRLSSKDSHPQSFSVMRICKKIVYSCTHNIFFKYRNPGGRTVVVTFFVVCHCVNSKSNISSSRQVELREFEYYVTQIQS